MTVYTKLFIPSPHINPRPSADLAHDINVNADLNIDQLSALLASVDKVLLADVGNFQAWFNKGLILKKLNAYPHALQCFNQALNLCPDDTNTLVECGNLLFELEQFEFALAHHDFALQLNKDCIPALNSKALSLLRLQRASEALTTSDQLTSLVPDFAPALLTRASIQHALGQHDQALATYQKIISLGQATAMLYCNMANLCWDMLNIEQAKAYYLKALHMAPDNPTIHWNAALFYLSTGDFERGWKFYESGKYAPHRPRGQRKASSIPTWDGTQSLAGKRILLYSEQGFGDTIQFVRYAQHIADAGAKVIIEVQESLVSLINTLGETFEVVSYGNVQNTYDYQCSLLSLPCLLNTTLSNIPNHTPYLFANSNKSNASQKTAVAPLRIGLVWSGATTHHNDKNRSISLKEIQPLLSLNASFHCLQKEIRADDLALLQNLNQLHTYQETIHDFSDTAALISTMDLIISVDTSVAHLAGAMNKPLWLLIPNPPDFRWMLTRKDSPWYPSATLFRNESGDWQTVIHEVKGLLESLIRDHQLATTSQSSNV